MSEIPKIARARLEQQSAGAGSHPDADQLTAFVERSLGAREREQVLEHLSRCADCREVVAVTLPSPPEEASRVAQPAREFRWFEWQTLRWAAVAATFVIAVTLVFQAGWEKRAQFSDETAENRPVAAPAPATASDEAAKQAAPAQADKIQPPAPGGTAAKEKAPSAPSSSAVAVSRDQETEAARGPSKLDSVTHAKAGQKSGELAVNGRAGGIGGGMVGGARMDDSKKLGSEGKVKVETGGGTLAAKPATSAPAMAAESKRGPAMQQQQAGALAQQAPPSPPAARAELQRQAAAEPASRAAADRAEAAKVTGQNETVAVESVEKDADKRARNAAPAEEFGDIRKMSKAAATLRWVITAQGRVERSIDNGRTWKDVSLDWRIKFRAVAASGSEVWAGGEGGALYHSSDSGDHWTRVALPAQLASATIVRVEFTDAERSTLATSAGETWTTSDSGATWRKR